jgi:hypothetical protein
MGCATGSFTRPGEVSDYDTFTSAFTGAFVAQKTEDGLFLKEKYPQWYRQMIDKITATLLDPDATPTAKEVATELFYWAESLGRTKER